MYPVVPVRYNRLYIFQANLQSEFCSHDILDRYSEGREHALNLYFIILAAVEIANVFFVHYLVKYVSSDS